MGLPAQVVDMNRGETNERITQIYPMASLTCPLLPEGAAS